MLIISTHCSSPTRYIVWFGIRLPTPRLPAYEVVGYNLWLCSRTNFLFFPHSRSCERCAGVMLGVAGAVREPVIGLRSGGFAGMTTGLFTGWVGLVLRPMYGTLMSTSQVSTQCRGDPQNWNAFRWASLPWVVLRKMLLRRRGRRAIMRTMVGDINIERHQGPANRIFHVKVAK